MDIEYLIMLIKTSNEKMINPIRPILNEIPDSFLAEDENSTWYALDNITIDQYAKIRQIIAQREIKPPPDFN